ncbi:MAG: aspartyl/glutamyl-tRNA(Asn/Gln) amidotransferase, A subunit [Parcubacteria bacterium C7867-005]|nr:MAG: aspartyl/glutamyl-tRNA(Asn/Gln) amidotransferase, A subunit [Parcubacteria bacterium C7867-005]
MIDLNSLTISSAREALKARKFSARELMEASIQTIKDKDSDIHAFLEVFEDALGLADEADKKIKEGVDLPLLGVPIALKDNMLVSGHKVSAGSKILENFTAPIDSTAVRKLKDAGAIIIGRTNMDEFAMGSSTENSSYGPTKNPIDPTRVPGGSSGGSAAAVASGMVIGALGSDTGGSIRQPAAFCGLVGLKPTYGRVSRSGLIAYGSSLDQIGPLVKTVSDAEILYDVLKGQDPMDSTTIGDQSYPKKKDFKKIIGVPRSFVESEGVSPEIKKNFQETEKRFRDLGYEVRDIELEHLRFSLSVYYIVALAESSSNLARFDGVKYGLHVDGDNGIDDYFKTRGAGFGQEVRRRIILGTYVLSSGYYDEYYNTALKVRKLITDEFRKVFMEVDLILTPTTPTSAWKMGEKSTSPLEMYLEDIFTVPANTTGCPAISLPSGHEEINQIKLPLGIELTADLGREDNLLKAGKEFLGEK